MDMLNLKLEKEKKKMFPHIYLLAPVVLRRVPAELLSGQVHFTSEESNFQTLNCSSVWLQDPLRLLRRTEELSACKNTTNKLRFERFVLSLSLSLFFVCFFVFLDGAGGPCSITRLSWIVFNNEGLVLKIQIRFVPRIS